MLSLDGELVELHKPYMCIGEVEDWLKGLELHISATLKFILNKYKDNLSSQDADFERQHWIDDKIAQLCLLLDMISWTEEVTKAFEERDEGTDDAMRTCSKSIKLKLEKMIDKVIAGPKDGMDEKGWKALKTKTIAIITIQVHQRDVVIELVQKDIKDVGSFNWVQQLRFEFAENEENEELKTAHAKVCDWSQE